MATVDLVQTAAILLVCALGVVLSFIVWRMGLWVQRVACALGSLVAVVQRDFEMRHPKEAKHDGG